MKDDVIELKKQHEETYRNAVIDNIKNNTDVLVDQDITSLLKKPPLDSMDFLKTKLFDLAKRNNVVLNTDNLTSLLDNYRNYLLKSCEEIKLARIDDLTATVNSISLNKNTDIIKINKKDFLNINKRIKKILKDYLNDAYEEYILKHIHSIFLDETPEEVRNNIIDDISKYIKGNYQRQLLDNCDIKILVKDTTLINGTKEQGERYLFTLNNSRLFKDLDD